MCFCGVGVRLVFIRSMVSVVPMRMVRIGVSLRAVGRGFIGWVGNIVDRIRPRIIVKAVGRRIGEIWLVSDSWWWV